MKRAWPAFFWLVLALAALASAGAPAAPLAAVPTLSWQAPAQVKAGEQFTAVLRLSSHGPLRGLPLLVGFDPQLLQVVKVVEGDFFRQANGRTVFSQQVDAAKGKIVVAVVRQAASGRDASVNGDAGVVAVTFKALKGGSSARLQLLSASPDPAPASRLALPVEQVVRVVW